MTPTTSRGLVALLVSVGAVTAFGLWLVLREGA